MITLCMTTFPSDNTNELMPFEGDVLDTLCYYTFQLYLFIACNLRNELGFQQSIRLSCVQVHVKAFQVKM